MKWVKIQVAVETTTTETKPAYAGLDSPRRRTSYLSPRIPFARPMIAESLRNSDAILGGLALGVPMLAGGGWIVWALDRQYRKQLESEQKQEDDRLNSIFF